MRTYLLLLLALLSFAACKKEAITPYECAGVTPTFTANIQPILKTNCMVSSCHGTFDQYSDVQKYANNNKLLGSIQHKKGYFKMPKNAAQLDDQTIKLISCWVQNGAPEK